MKKEEKTRLTREKIIQAAIVEFGLKSYETASLNTICNENKISKGLIYHNFKNKDEVYLTCVEECYDALISYMGNIVFQSKNVRENLAEILKKRQKFFEEYPYYRNIFFNSILMPPKHLFKELKEIKKGYDAYLKGQYIELVGEMNLRKGISVERAMQYLMIFQEMYNGYFRERYGEEDFETLVETHETKLSELLDMMLYGIAVESKGEE